jgi:hypothetical protein
VFVKIVHFVTGVACSEIQAHGSLNLRIISKTMKADWIEIKRDNLPPQFAGLRGSMTPKGEIVINRFAYQMVGAPTAFLIFYDKINQRIGLKPSILGQKNAYPAVRSGRSGAKMVRGHRLVREQRINLAHTIQFDDVQIDEDGIVILDLRTAIVSRRSLGHIAARKARIATGAQAHWSAGVIGAQASRLP